MDKKIGYIGGGNMARSLIGGMAEAVPGSAANIMVSDPLKDIRDDLERSFSVAVTDDNKALVAACDIVVIALKPQVMQSVLEPLADAFNASQPLVVSVAAGIRMDAMARWLGGYSTIVRVMPNTPALVGMGAAGLYADPSVTAEQSADAQKILDVVGATAWVTTEDDIDSVTALSGSGPAYFFYLMEVMEKTGRELGLAPQTVRTLTLATARGAAELAAQSPDDFATLRKKVTSPGGTTEAAINAMDAADGRQVIANGIRSAAERSRELAESLA